MAVYPIVVLQTCLSEPSYIPVLDKFVKQVMSSLLRCVSLQLRPVFNNQDFKNVLFENLKIDLPIPSPNKVGYTDIPTKFKQAGANSLAKNGIPKKENLQNLLLALMLTICWLKPM